MSSTGPMAMAMYSCTCMDTRALALFSTTTEPADCSRRLSPLAMAVDENFERLGCTAEPTIQHQDKSLTGIPSPHLDPGTGGTLSVLVKEWRGRRDSNSRPLP